MLKCKRLVDSTLLKCLNMVYRLSDQKTTFYSLKELVVCKLAGCNQAYNDARILPSGNRTCAAHIEMMVVSKKGDDDKMIKCSFCGAMHTCAENGNEVTRFLDKLVKLDKIDRLHRRVL